MTTITITADTTFAQLLQMKAAGIALVSKTFKASDTPVAPSITVSFKKVAA